MKKRVADIIMDTLADNGVTQAFCVVGGGAMYLDNALGIHPRIKTIFNHHEQACAMAAEGYARYSHVPALCCVTTGPGGTNTLTGVMGAYVDNIPMIVISGQCRYNTTVAEAGLPLRQRGIQEFNIVDTVKTMTKYAKMVIDPLEIKREVQKAYDIAMSGRRGPVWLDIPQNVQSALVEEDDLLSPEAAPLEVSASSECLKKTVEILREAKRPVIMAGSAVRSSGVWKDFLNFLENFKIPVVGACVQPDVLYHEHPLYCGSSGSVGTRAGNFILQNADVLLVLGAALNFAETGFVQENFAPNAHVIMVNVDAAEPLKPGLHVKTFVHSDLKRFFDALKNEKVFAPKTWFDYVHMICDKFDLFEAAEDDNRERVNSYNFWKIYNQREPENNITVLGNNSGVSPRLQNGMNKPGQRTIANINCGSMGYDVPAAIGAARAAERSVVLVTGDGSFMMNMQELQTIVHYQLPVKIVLFANDGYNGIRQTCKNYFGGKLVGCDKESGVSFPSFEKLSEAFGFPYYRCGCNIELADSIEWLLAQPSYALLEVAQKYENPPQPRVVSRLRDDGTSEPACLQDMFPFLDGDLITSLMIGEK